MSAFEHIATNVQQFIEDQINCSAKLVTDEQKEKWPLDPRAMPYKMFIAEDVLIVPKEHIRYLDYYGGFEYVRAEHRVELGEYTLFDAGDERVAEVVEAFHQCTPSD